MIIAGSFKRLLLTVTGFTVAHSITLSLATLDIFRLPTELVELIDCAEYCCYWLWKLLSIIEREAVSKTALPGAIRSVSQQCIWSITWLWFCGGITGTGLACFNESSCAYCSLI